MNTKLEAAELKQNKNPVRAFIKKHITLRLAVQAFIVGVMFYAAWNFYGFYQYLQGYAADSLPYRPPVVEGFMPIAAIVAFKAMFLTGTIDPIHPAGLVILMAILITALIFRRALCSWICPLGTLSEYLGKLGKRVMGRNLTIPKWLDIGLLVLKYGLFLFIIRVLILMSAEEAAAFMQIPYYIISDVKMFEMFLDISFLGILIIFALMALSFLFKSFWCRYLCPYGALQGILGLLSPFILKKNSATCTKCGRCNEVCPSRVNVQDRKSVVVAVECTGCTDCVTACPQPQTLEFKFLGILPVNTRIFAMGFIAVFFGIILLAMLTGHWESNVNLDGYKAVYGMMNGMF